MSSYRFTFIVHRDTMLPGNTAVEVIVQAPTVASALMKIDRVITEVIGYPNCTYSTNPKRIEEI